MNIATAIARSETALREDPSFPCGGNPDRQFNIHRRLIPRQEVELSTDYSLNETFVRANASDIAEGLHECKTDAQAVAFVRQWRGAMNESQMKRSF